MRPIDNVRIQSGRGVAYPDAPILGGEFGPTMTTVVRAGAIRVIEAIVPNSGGWVTENPSATISDFHRGHLVNSVETDRFNPSLGIGAR
jgi:hypothetical protein